MMRMRKKTTNRQPLTTTTVNGKIRYEFSAKLWQHALQGGWHFVSLPKKLSKEIRQHLGWQEEGWGRLKATAKTGASEWETAIWFDTKQNTYLLPVKTVVRKKENLPAGKTVKIILWV